MQSRSFYFLFVVIGLGLLSGLLYWKTSYKLGLDVKGGVRFTYEVSPTKKADGTVPPIEETIKRTQTILQNRISSVTGVAEGTVIVKGGNQIIVEIPGYADIDKAREQIGTSASLKVYFASNVRPESASPSYRRYDNEPDTDKSSNPSVSFTDTITKKTIKPGDPEYLTMIEGWQLLATGDQLVDAQPEAIGNGNYRPTIRFDDAAGEKIKQWSTQYRGKGEKLAFVLDNRVLQIAPVNKDSILGKEIVVEGSFTAAYVTGLTSLLNAGALPADLKLLSSEKVDPTIGQSALSKMIFAGVIAFVVIAVFLAVYYAFPGLVALFALGLYVLFTLSVLKVMGATFSLAAIAGFVLSVGMAVDANILVFERFKEEIKKGRALHDALQLGFSRALPAIIDSNACSILTSLVLASIGTGPVKGFATTLIIGVLISLFTAVTVTRSLLFFLTDSGIGNDVKMYGLNRNWFGENLESDANAKPLQIVNNSRKWFAITAVFIVAGVACIAAGGLKPNVEFTGGFEAVYSRTSDFPSAQTIEANLEKHNIKGSNVKFGTGDKGADLAYITVPGSQLKDSGSTGQDAFIRDAAGLPSNAVALSTSNVGPTIQKETTNNAIIGVVASFALIVVYLGFRFGVALGSFQNGLRFGMSAILAGAKDVVVILGVAAAVGLKLGWEISSLFITAMLTVIGFSVHDKIVIFDRVRENLRHPLAGETFDNLVNRSVTQSFARSINTAATVVVTLGILIAFGTTTPDLKFFCVAMLAGIAWGTYSSIYTAAPVLCLWEHAVEKRNPNATLLATSLADLARKRTMRTTSVPVPAASTDAPVTSPDGTRTYGQVKRRASAVSRSKVDLDD